VSAARTVDPLDDGRVCRAVAVARDSQRRELIGPANTGQYPGAGQAPGLRKVTETLAVLAVLLPGDGVNVIVPVPPQGTMMAVVTGSGS
jgi:hypothetical protein